MSKQNLKRNRRGVIRTSWEPVADWYVGWNGKHGSKHHRALAIPAVLELLGVYAGMELLEIGCGHGVLAPDVIRAGARYTGVDASPRLIRRARAYHGQMGIFVVGDARNLAGSRELTGSKYDSAVFLLSVQDMEPLASVLRSAAWAVKVGGSVVLLMVHPCFRVPRQSGWGWDDGRKLQYRRVDRYLTPLRVPMHAYPGAQQGATMSFHRPLSDYINGLAAAGFLLEQMQEIPGDAVQIEGKRAKAEKAANREIPLFLGLRARKTPP